MRVSHWYTRVPMAATTGKSTERRDGTCASLSRSADLLLPCLEVPARFRAALVALHLRGLARLGLGQLAPELLPHGVGRVVGVRDGQAGFERGDRGVPLLALLLPRVQVLRSLLAVGLSLRLRRVSRRQWAPLTPR